MQILQRKRSAHPLRHYAMQQNERNTALYEAILRLNTLDECIRFFDDLCAVTELRTMEQRYAVAGCLLQGKVYSEIRRETGASSATVSRVNRMLNYGTGSVAERRARGPGRPGYCHRKVRRFPYVCFDP